MMIHKPYDTVSRKKLYNLLVHTNIKGGKTKCSKSL